MAKKNNFLNKNYPLIISYVIIKLCQNNNKKFNFPLYLRKLKLSLLLNLLLLHK